MNTYIPLPIQVPARLSSSLNQPPTPTKAAIAVREIVRSTAPKSRLVSQPCRYPGGTRGASSMGGTVYQRSSRKRYHLFFRLHAALLFLPELPDQQRRLWKRYFRNASRGIFWNCRHRCAQYQSGDADSVPSVATARLKTGQTAAFHPYRLQLRRL